MVGFRVDVRAMRLLQSSLMDPRGGSDQRFSRLNGRPFLFEDSLHGIFPVPGSYHRVPGMGS